MKKFYTLLACAALATTASAQVMIGTQNYTSLADAINAANEGDVVTITSDVNISSRVNIGKSITITAENNARIIVEKNFNQSRILINGGDVVLKNIILDGNDIDTNQTGIEENNSAKSATLENVTIMNFKTSGRGIINKKPMVLDNIKFENCTGRNVFVGANGLTVKGSGEYLMYVESNYTVTADNFTGKIDLSVQTASARTIVNGGSLENFTWSDAPEYWSLVQNGNNLAMEYSKPVAQVVNGEETTTYTTLSAAFGAVPNNGTIILLADAELTDRALFGNKNVTITSDEGQLYTIKRTMNNGNNLSFECNYTFTLKNVIFDQNNMNINKPIFNMKGHGVFENVQVKNAGNCSSIVDLGLGKTITINNMELIDCANSNVNCPGTATISGNTNLSFVLSGTGNIKVGELTNAEPIELSFADAAAYLGTTFITGENVDAAKFAVPAGMTLEAAAGGLKLGIGAPAVSWDEDAKTITAKTEVGTIWYKVVPITSSDSAHVILKAIESSSDDDAITTDNGWTDSEKAEYTTEYSGNNNYLFAVKSGETAGAPATVEVTDGKITTGIDTVEAEENAPAEYYNLQGVRVANPENGIFIRRQGSKTSKVAL